MDLRIETSAHINLLEESLSGSNEIFNLTLSSGVLEFDIGPTVLTSSYPGNNTWFNLKLVGNLASSTWNVYLDGVFLLGSYIAGADQVGSVNFSTEVGDEYYIDDIEWYIISDDDCISNLAPLTVTVEECLSVNDEEKFYIKLFPNPTTGILNFSTSSNIEELQILDLHGKIILETNMNTINGSINLKNFTKGIYTVKAFSKTGIIHQKIILH